MLERTISVMSKMMFIFIFWLGLSLAASAETMVAGQIDPTEPAYILTGQTGEDWAANYDTKRQIHLKNVTGNADLIVNEGSESLSRGLAFHLRGEHLYVVWAEKISGMKKLWLRASHDGGKTLAPPVLLDTESEPLPRMVIDSDEQGHVVVFFLGEKKADSDFSIYSVSSDDFGKTFSKTTRISEGYTHAIYPALLRDGSVFYAFTYGRKDDKKYMVMRKSEDGGKSWSAPVEIAETAMAISPMIETRRVGKRIHVFWFNSVEGAYSVQEAFSDDEGKTWKSAELGPTKGLQVGLFKVADDMQKMLYIAYYGVKEEKEKGKVFFMRSADNGDTWEEAIKLRRYPFDNTMARNPDVLANNKGEVLVVWEDYRNIRSNLYMQYSRDYGKTWQEEDIPLEEAGKSNTRQFRDGKSLRSKGGRYYLAAFRFANDSVMGETEQFLFEVKAPVGEKIR